jgi:hypothetical protein
MSRELFPFLVKGETSVDDRDEQFDRILQNSDVGVLERR